MIERKDLYWDGPDLRRCGGRHVLATIVPDAKYDFMWRVRLPAGALSDMCNLSRARDAAVAMALAKLNHRLTA